MSVKGFAVAQYTVAGEQVLSGWLAKDVTLRGVNYGGKFAASGKSAVGFILGCLGYSLVYETSVEESANICRALFVQDEAFLSFGPPWWVLQWFVDVVGVDVFGVSGFWDDQVSCFDSGFGGDDVGGSWWLPGFMIDDGAPAWFEEFLSRLSEADRVVLGLQGFRLNFGQPV